MHAKTVEGLVGARMNMNMSRVPMRVYKEAENRGDVAGMERAMQYAGGFLEQAKDYQEKAAEGMEEEREEIREEKSRESKKAAEKCWKESKEQERDWKNVREERKDTVEISQEGRELSAAMGRKDGSGPMEGKTDAINSSMR